MIKYDRQSQRIDVWEKQNVNLASGKLLLQELGVAFAEYSIINNYVYVRYPNPKKENNLKPEGRNESYFAQFKQGDVLNEKRVELWNHIKNTTYSKYKKIGETKRYIHTFEY